MRNIQIDEWTECYPSKWKGLIVQEAMKHPAKFSRPLLRRIYQHAQQAGWIKTGDSIIDPFGGVALGALDAMTLGMHWTGIELEKPFAELGTKNIDLWNSKYAGKMASWGTARLLNGDSRYLLSVINGQVMAISSPSYAESLARETVDSASRRALAREHDISNAEHISPIDMEKIGKRNQEYGETAGQLGAMKDSSFDLALSSPPFLQASGGAHIPKGMEKTDPGLGARHAAGNKSSHAYGKSDGQLSSMKDNDFDMALSSPPYSGNMQVEKNDKGINLEKQYESYKKSGGGQDFEGFRKTQEFHSQGYGTTDGNLANMPTKDFDMALSSPPYENMLNSESNGIDWSKAKKDYHGRVTHGKRVEMLNRHHNERRYGAGSDQLGNDKGDSFWISARQIIDQTFCCLKPGGHAIWVVKGYVNKKKYVDFPDQWRQVCEAAGFVTLHEHHALLVHAQQHTLEGGIHNHESKSFFRRLAEKKGSPRIDFETIFCMEKPS